MATKYLVGVSVEMTVEAETANKAVAYFIDWLSTTEGSHCITAIEKSKSFKPKRG